MRCGSFEINCFTALCAMHPRSVAASSCAVAMTPEVWLNHGKLAKTLMPAPAPGGDDDERYSAQQHSMEQILAAKLAEVAPTPEGRAALEVCLVELEKTVSLLTPGWSVRPFGSASNGFSTHRSDLDATVCRVPCAAGAGAPLGAEALQDNLFNILTAHESFDIVENVRAARVPILRLKFRDCLDVDLSFQNVEPLPNTRLLRAYAELHPSVRVLGVLVKLWAKGEGVSGAQSGHLSPYALTLMAIYFMQVDPAIRLPCLDVSLFHGGPCSPTGLSRRHGWCCDLGGVQLLSRFFKFFSTQFKWGSEVVSVRHGCRLLASDCEFAQLKGKGVSRLHIQDPFLVGRNLHCVLKTASEGKLISRLWDAGQRLRAGELPTGLRLVQVAEGRVYDPESFNLISMAWKLLDEVQPKDPPPTSVVGAGAEGDDSGASTGSGVEDAEARACLGSSSSLPGESDGPSSLDGCAADDQVEVLGQPVEIVVEDQWSGWDRIHIIASGPPAPRVPPTRLFQPICWQLVPAGDRQPIWQLFSADQKATARSNSTAWSLPSF